MRSREKVYSFEGAPCVEERKMGTRGWQMGRGDDRQGEARGLWLRAGLDRDPHGVLKFGRNISTLEPVEIVRMQLTSV